MHRPVFPPIVVIAGPTASGKSQLALELAEKFSGSIINGDSRQVYKELSIGTDRPVFEKTVEEIGYIEDIPHYLYGYKSIFDPYNLFSYQQDVFKLLSSLSSEQPVFLVGGTGLYIDSVVFNYLFNKDGYSKGEELNHLYLVINSERQVIRNKISIRVDQMFSNGLLEEASRYKKEIIDGQYRALNTIGYQEFREYWAGEISVEEAKQKIKTHTHQYAKRQVTWFKRNKNAIWVDNLHTVNDTVSEFLMKSSL